MKCRHCHSELRLPFVDLGSAPPSNRYLTQQTLKAPEAWYPLRVLVCEQCWLVQTEDLAQAKELFDKDYAYFSSFAPSWLAHCERYVAEMANRFDLDETSHVIEVAANDGGLLQYVQARGISCLGIEPTASTAAAARLKGIPIIEEFFGVSLAKKVVQEERLADLMVANNVLAHVPDINDFVAGFALCLKPCGIATFEFPHLMKLIEGVQFDTIYHEHFSYLSLTAVCTIFAANGLSVFDVDELFTHGGSLRIYAQRTESGIQPRSLAVDAMLEREASAGILTRDYYASFQSRADEVKNNFIRFLLEARRESKLVVAYGAAAKGNTLLNYAGIRPDLIPFVVDRNPSKQGKYLPGSRISIVDERKIRQAKPDYVVILPWNLKNEVMGQLNYIRDWDAHFVTAVPEMEVQ